MPGLGLGNHEVPCGRVTLEISFADTEAVTQQCIIRRFLQPKLRSQLRLENGRTVITEIDDFAGRIVAEIIVVSCLHPIPSLSDVVGDRSRRDFQIFTLIERAAMPLRVGIVTTRRGAAVAHLNSPGLITEQIIRCFVWSVDSRFWPVSA